MHQFKGNSKRATAWARSSEKLTMNFLSIPIGGVLQRRAAMSVSNYIITCGWRSLSSSAASKKVGTHNGKFHCDEALGCFMIRRTAKFLNADIVRSRDPLVWRIYVALFASDCGGVKFWWKPCCFACDVSRFWISSTPSWTLEEFTIRAEIDTITIRKVLRRFWVADLKPSSAVLVLSIRCSL